VIDARDYHALSRSLGDVRPTTIVQLAAIAPRQSRPTKIPSVHSITVFERWKMRLDCARGSAEHFIYFFFIDGVR